MQRGSVGIAGCVQIWALRLSRQKAKLATGGTVALSRAAHTLEEKDRSHSLVEKKTGEVGASNPQLTYSTFVANRLVWRIQQEGQISLFQAMAAGLSSRNPK